MARWPGGPVLSPVPCPPARSGMSPPCSIPAPGAGGAAGREPGVLGGRFVPRCQPRCPASPCPPSPWAMTHGDGGSKNNYKKKKKEKKCFTHQNKSHSFRRAGRKDGHLAACPGCHVPTRDEPQPGSQPCPAPGTRTWPWWGLLPRQEERPGAEGGGFAPGTVARASRRQWPGATEEQLGTACAGVHTSRPCRLPG